jgi:hypothetical protein
MRALLVSKDTVDDISLLPPGNYQLSNYRVLERQHFTLIHKGNTEEENNENGNVVFKWNIHGSAGGCEGEAGCRLPDRYLKTT